MVAGETGVRLVVVLATVAGLWIGARLLVDAAARLARDFGLSELTIGLTVVAVGTSTPELSVTVDAAFKGLGDIAVANVLGSNIYNLAFILGVVSLLRVVPIAESLVRRDGVALLASTLVGGAVVFDLAVSRLEGALLVGLFAAYTRSLLRTGRPSAKSESGATRPDGVASAVTERVAFPGRDVVFLVVGLALVLVSGDYLVWAASALARGAGVSEWMIGGTIVAAGTSTPEFVVSVVGIQRGNLGVSVGNIIGSNIVNLTGIMGVAALVRPLWMSGAVLETLWWLIGISVVVVVALWTGRVLSRVEGALLACSELVRWTLGLFG